MVYNVKGIDKRIIVLEEKIKEGVIIPEELKDNLKWTTTSLGGLFLEFWSNKHIKNTYRENSKKYFSLYICCEGNFGQYVKDEATLECDRSKGFSIRGIRKPTATEKIIIKVNKIINDNMPLMMEGVKSELC